MTTQHIKDVVMFRLNALELRQVMEEHGMVYSVWMNLLADVNSAARGKRWTQKLSGLKVFHEERGRGHVLQCRVHLWKYFQEVEAANPLEREIRSEMLALGLSGEADRRMLRYS